MISSSADGSTLASNSSTRANTGSSIKYSAHLPHWAMGSSLRMTIVLSVTLKGRLVFLDCACQTAEDASLQVTRLEVLSDGRPASKTTRGHRDMLPSRSAEMSHRSPSARLRVRMNMP